MIVNNSIFGGTTSQSSGIQYSQGAAVTVVLDDRGVTLVLPDKSPATDEG